MLHALRLAGNGRYVAAADEFEEIDASLSGGSFQTSYFSGFCWLKANLLKNAILAFDRAVKFQPDDYGLRLHFGWACHMLGLVGEANIHWWVAYQTNDNAEIRNIIRRYFLDDHHPEKLALYPLCHGKGIDVGCGNRKTHPDAIGVDVLARGQVGRLGCVTGKSCRADLVASGDELVMFGDAELDYVVQRHNLEHYQDPVKALQEWKRVLKPGGMLGMVVPDDAVVDTIRLDESHKHVFTQDSLARLLHLVGGFEMIHMGELLRNWSFVCIAQRSGDTDGLMDIQRCDYPHRLNQLKLDMLKTKAAMYRKHDAPQLADQCLQVMELILNGKR